MASGFTLLELSIVLVIIGLVIAGVLVGRNLIAAAEVRATISQKENYDTAAGAFRTKYNCIPGDCADVTSFGFSDVLFPGAVPSGEGGDGNGIIGNVSGQIMDCTSGQPGNCFGSIGIERVRFWEHLQQAQLIGDWDPALPNAIVGAGTFTPMANTQWFVGYSQPQAYTVGGPNPLRYGLAAGFGANAFMLIGQDSDQSTICGVFSCGGVMFAEALKSPDALAIDSKLDDGKPLTGSVRAASSTIGGRFTSPPPAVGEPEGKACVVSSTINDYASATDGYAPACNLMFKSVF